MTIKKKTLLNPCYTCSATGKIKDKKCSVCNGTGKYAENHYHFIDEKQKIAFSGDTLK